MGVIYFFPGLWKIITSQLYWAFSDNMKYQLYEKWFLLDGWTPFFRIDHYPFLYKLGGLMTLLFETSFIFLILFPKTRMLAAISGLLFHNFTNLFMKI